MASPPAGPSPLLTLLFSIRSRPLERLHQKGHKMADRSWSLARRRISKRQNSPEGRLEKRKDAKYIAGRSKLSSARCLLVSATGSAKSIVYNALRWRPTSYKKRAGSPYVGTRCRCSFRVPTHVRKTPPRQTRYPTSTHASECTIFASGQVKYLYPAR